MLKKCKILFDGLVFTGLETVMSLIVNVPGVARIDFISAADKLVISLGENPTNFTAYPRTTNVAS